MKVPDYIAVQDIGDFVFMLYDPITPLVLMTARDYGRSGETWDDMMREAAGIAKHRRHPVEVYAIKLIDYDPYMEEVFLEGPPWHRIVTVNWRGPATRTNP